MSETQDSSTDDIQDDITPEITAAFAGLDLRCPVCGHDHFEAVGIGPINDTNYAPQLMIGRNFEQIPRYRARLFAMTCSNCGFVFSFHYERFVDWIKREIRKGKADG